MFNITLKRPLVTLAVTAGLLVASAGPASASPIYMHFNDFQGGSAPIPTSDLPASNSSKDQLSGIPANAGAPLSYTLSNSMISGYS